MDKDHKARIIEDFIKSEGRKIMNEEINGIIEKLDKKLTREGMKEEDMLNDKNNLLTYTKYDLYALTRNRLQEIIRTPDKIIREGMILEGQKDYRKKNL